MHRRLVTAMTPTWRDVWTALQVRWTRKDARAEAEPLYLESLESRQRLLKRDHPIIARSLNNLAYVRKALGNLAGAQPLYEQALEIRRRLFNGDHPKSQPA